MADMFKDKVVVVTGGARNTGLEIVDSFVREGAKVFFCGSAVQLYPARCEDDTSKMRQK